MLPENLLKSFNLLHESAPCSEPTNVGKKMLPPGDVGVGGRQEFISARICVCGQNFDCEPTRNRHAPWVVHSAHLSCRCLR